MVTKGEHAASTTPYETLQKLMVGIMNHVWSTGLECEAGTEAMRVAWKAFAEHARGDHPHGCPPRAEWPEVSTQPPLLPTAAALKRIKRERG